MADNDKLKGDDGLVLALARGLAVRETAQEAGVSEQTDGLTILSSVGGRWGYRASVMPASGVLGMAPPTVTASRCFW